MRIDPQGVFDYHEKTKHLPERYAPSPMGMDWATEPSPYRRYEGAQEVALPLLKEDPAGGYHELFARVSEPRPFDTKNISAFLELSMGLSAIKSFMESTWALRINPSSGNLHPTESYIITLDKTPEEGVFHYNPGLHALEKRASLTATIIEGLKKTFGAEGFITCLTSIDWREAWKYGARAFRYSCIDTGHAIASMSFSAALLGWQVTPLYTLSDDDITDMLGFNDTIWTRYEEERAEAAFFVHSATDPITAVNLEETIIKAFRGIRFEGRPNRLSSDHVHWPIIEEVAKLTKKWPVEATPYEPIPPHEYMEDNLSNIKGASVIRSRRSAQAFNSTGRISKEGFFTIIDRTVPAPLCAPFTALPGEPRINLLLFVHRVEGLAKGLYMLIRNKKDLQELKKSMREDFLWKQTEYSGLYLLMEGDLTDEARYISCQQDIAGDGVFAAAMIARFREVIEERPSSYRDLFMEAGLVGQVLYLTAEAHGLRGTGIGCFYDDIIHEFMGLDSADKTFQSLYHFTVGAPLVDSRITTSAPYHGLR